MSVSGERWEFTGEVVWLLDCKHIRLAKIHLNSKIPVAMRAAVPHPHSSILTELLWPTWVTGMTVAHGCSEKKE